MNDNIKIQWQFSDPAIVVYIDPKMKDNYVYVNVKDPVEEKLKTMSEFPHVKELLKKF